MELKISLRPEKSIESNRGNDPTNRSIILIRVDEMSPNQNRNLSERLIKIIEADAENLSRVTVKTLQTNVRTPSYHKLSANELHHRVYSVYHNLGRWLCETSDQAIQAWYSKLGDDRREEDIPLGEVLWALVLTKNRLTDYLGAYAFADSALELYQQQEFDRLIAHFFDRALCYTAEGYEWTLDHRSAPPATVLH